MPVNIEQTSQIAGNEKKTGSPLKFRPPTAEKDRATQHAVREFEALFVEMMLKSMRSTIPRDELTGGGRGEEIYRSLLDQEYAKAIAAQGGVGLASLVTTQITGRDSKK